MNTHSLRGRGLMILTCALLFALTGWVGCSDDHGHSHDAGGGHGDKDAKAAGHGEEHVLGSVEIDGREFSVVLFGEATPGKECAFEVQGVGMDDAELAKLNLYLWLEDEGGTVVSASSKGEREGKGLHFHATPRTGKGDPHRVVLRLRAEGTDERAGLPLSGHGHEHHDGPHHGMLAAFTGKSGVTGFIELKLHDDKGDLELWLAQDEEIATPFDLPLDTGIEIEFVDVAGKKVTLKPRNRTQNEDEDGKPNLRNGKTNYFIYPTEAGQDASWLKGKEFSSIVIVRFQASGTSVVSEEFVLKPHVH